MQERHRDRKRYFNEQSITTEKYVIPFIAQTTDITKMSSVLEIGCGEGGNLLPFLNNGFDRIVGIDLNEQQIENARHYFSEHPTSAQIEFIFEDIYNVKNDEQFDIIMMRDVIEHIHDQEKFMRFVKRFLKPNGKFFLGFPPWYNPFGGHQQICKNRFLSKLPYFHVLPKPIYRLILNAFKEDQKKIDDLIEIKETGITLERFERILTSENYHSDEVCHYFINPNYEIKFGLKPRKIWKVISSIPFFRNFVITCGYYVVSIDEF